MKKLFYLAILSWLIPQATPASAQPVTPAAETAARERIIGRAPIVFVGRSLQGQSYKSASGVIYKSSVIQILEVLRGAARLKPGTVEWVDSLPQTPGLEELHRFGGTSGYEGGWGVYFAAPSTYPAKAAPYHTTNGPLILQPVNGDQEAVVSVQFTDDGPVIQGLYRGWGGEEQVISYINGLPRLKAIPGPIDEARYPVLKYHDKRPGGRDLNKEVDKKKPQTAATVAAPTDTGVKAKSLPLEAFQQLPRVLDRIRSQKPLSKQDSAFIKRYIPEQMPNGRQPKKKDMPARKAKKRAGATGQARVAGFDTTLVLAVRNLKIVKMPGCGRAYQGEVWLKANQAGLYMNQLYFEMSTTADLQLDSSPFGQTLVGSYTPLAGAPGYAFYQYYDAAAKRILVVCYAPQNNPQRVALPPAAAQPFFRFQYGAADPGTTPGSGGPAPTGGSTTTTPASVAFSPLATIPSQSNSNYYLSAFPVDEQPYVSHRFTALEADSASKVRRPGVRINSLHTENKALVAAGTEMLLTVHGVDFGSLTNPADTTQKSRLQFINAETDPGQFLYDMDRSEVELWSDTLIQVRIPSTAIRTASSPPKRNTVGGGAIKISTYCGQEAQSPDTLDIQYNLSNIQKNVGNVRLYLAGRDCSRGMTFYLSPELSAEPVTKAVIKSALRSWSVQLGVPLLLSTTSTTRGINDGQNVIYRARAPLPTEPDIAAMATTISPQEDSASTTAVDGVPKPRWAIVDTDIAISPVTAWSYDTTGIALCASGYGSPGCQQDFYAALVHEIGHILALKHVVDPSDIMYYSLSDTQRRTITTGRMAAVAGASKSITDSRGIRWTAQGVGTFGQLLASCAQNRMAPAAAVPLPVSKESTLERAGLYPNPVSDEAEILPATADKGAWEYWVRDAQGRVVLHAQGAGAAPIKVGKGLPAGFYTIQLHTPQRTSTLKMIKGL